MKKNKYGGLDFWSHTRLTWRSSAWLKSHGYNKDQRRLIMENRFWNVILIIGIVGILSLISIYIREDQRREKELYRKTIPQQPPKDFLYE